MSQSDPIPRDDPAPMAKSPDWVICASEHSRQLAADVPPRRNASLIGWLVAAAALFNFLILPFARVVGEARNEAAAIFLIATALGVFATEVGIATLWLVWGPGTFLWRLAMHWAAAFALFIAWAIGFAIAFGDGGPPGGIPQVWGIVLCGLLLVSLSAQAVLWPLRIYFGWRIERPPQAPAAQPLAIRDFLAGTLVTSVTLAALRLLPQQISRDPDFWIVWGITALSSAGISAVSLLPAAVFLLRIREMAAAAGAWFTYAGAAWIATLLVVSSLAGSAPPGEAVLATLVVFGSFAAAMATPLLIARGRGYRLVFPGDLRQRATPPLAAPPGAAGPRAA